MHFELGRGSDHVESGLALDAYRLQGIARAEAQIGNMVGAENYYQYAEHYFRSMRSDSERT